MTKSGISQLRLFVLAMLIAVSQVAPAVAEQTNASAVKSNVATPNSGGATSATATPNAATPAAPPTAPAASITATVAPPAAPVKPSSSALTNDGIRAIADGRFSDATKVLEQAVALDAANAAARSNLVMAYNNLARQQAKTDQALAMKTLRKSLSLNPNQSFARQTFDSMVRYFGRDPSSFDDRVELGLLARQDKDISGVIYEYRAALAIHKDTNVEELLKEALGPQKVYPVRPPRPVVTVQPNANAAPQNAPKQGTPNAGAPGASAPAPVPASAPAAVPATAPKAVPATAPAAVPATPAAAPAAPAAVPPTPAAAPRPNPNPN